MKPEDVYNTFVQPGARKQLNLDSADVAKWRACEENGNRKLAKALVKDAQTRMLRLIGPHVELMKKKDGYSREVQKYGKRWKAMKPDFWAPLNTELDTILGTLDRIEKLYPK